MPSPTAASPWRAGTEHRLPPGKLKGPRHGFEIGTGMAARFFAKIDKPDRVPALRRAHARLGKRGGDGYGGCTGRRMKGNRAGVTQPLSHVPTVRPPAEQQPMRPALLTPP